MKFFELAFRLGIMIAIFGFIWGIIRLLLSLLRGGGVQSVVEEYLLKTAKYVLLVNVVVLNGFERGTNELMMRELLLTGLILFMYFVSNLQKDQQKHQFMKTIQTDMPLFQSKFSLAGEIVALTLSVAAFVFFVSFPQYASYGLSQWFYDGILSIESTFIIGFVFKVIGFFFLLNIVQKIINSIFSLLTGAPLFTVRREFREKKEDKDKDDDFDDFEEIK